MSRGYTGNRVTYVTVISGMDNDIYDEDLS